MESNIAENATSHKSTKLKSYNIQFRLEAVNFANKTQIVVRPGDRYSVAAKTIQEGEAKRKSWRN